MNEYEKLLNKSLNPNECIDIIDQAFDTFICEGIKHKILQKSINTLKEFISSITEEKKQNGKSKKEKTV